MKKIIFIIATALFTLLSHFSFANSTVKPLNTKNVNEVLIIYLEATSIGTADYNSYLFTEDFTYENAHNRYNKTDYIKFLTENQGKKYDCETKHEILDFNQQVAIAKNTLSFKSFTKVEHITLINTQQGWKINKVVSSYL